jgi:hypothetical protein
VRIGSLFLTLSLLQAAESKLPVPSPADQKKNEKSIHDLLKDGYSKKDQNSRRTLARTLLETGMKEADRTLAFSFLKEASDVAGEAIDFDTAMSAIEFLEKTYKVEPESLLTGGTFSPLHELRKALLKRVQKLAQSADDAQAYLKAATKLADQFYAEDSFDDGLAVSQFADAVAKASSDSGLQMVARGYVRKYGDLKREHDKVSKAHLKILSDPSDAEACGTWGQFLVFVKGDWETGLAFIAKGKDGVLKDVAAKEAAKAPALEIADGWLALAEKAKEPDRARYRTRARFWLETASADAAGVQKLQIEQKIKAIDDAMGVVDLLAIIDPKKDFVLGRPINKTSPPRFDGKRLIMDVDYFDRIDLPYVPPPEYDLTVVLQRPSGGHSLYMGLSNGQRQWCAAIGGWFGTPGILNVDGKAVELDDATKKASKLVDGEGATGTFTYSVRKSGFTASLNGKTAIDWTGDYSRLSLPADIAPSKQKGALILCCRESRLIIQKILLTPVSGQGQKLR